MKVKKEMDDEKSEFCTWGSRNLLRAHQKREANYEFFYGV